MGIGDSIGKAAENAMEDLAGTSRPAGDAHVPEPGASDGDVQVHSSLSEGSNAMENSAKETAGGSQRHQPTASGAAGGAGDAGRSNDASGAAEPREEAGDVPRDVPGAAGLPSSDPDKLRADPSEGDEDPSTALGRG
jgi:hypothetical protein